MIKPELIFVAGCNASGKSSFIRTRVNQLKGFEVIMTDVSKGRTKEVFLKAVTKRKNIVLETVFNDPSFAGMVDTARDAGYHSSLTVLFLDIVQHSLERSAFRNIEQSGLDISSGNIQINFNESFKNIARYFFYFDKASFIYTGITGESIHIMSFEKSKLTMYESTALVYPQKFAAYSFRSERMSEEVYQIITANQDYGDV